MSDLITLTPDNVEAVLPDVPKLVQFALTFASNLRRGTLDITLPDGRVVRCGGLELDLLTRRAKKLRAQRR